MKARASAPDAGDDDGAAIVANVRLLLAASTVVTVLTDPSIATTLPALSWIIFPGFTVHNILLYVLTFTHKAGPHHTLPTWLDLLWYTLLVLVTGGGGSLFFMFYFFAILVAAFRHGFDEGARITLASAALFTVAALVAGGFTELMQVMLRAAFLLALGYMIARWGEANLAQKRRLALLREVSRLSNPRFGVEQTIADVMEQVRRYFHGSACVAVNRRLGAPRWTMRIMTAAGPRVADLPEQGEGMVAPLMMSLPAGMPVRYTSALLPCWPWTGAFCYYDSARGQWRRCEGDSGARLAELLGVRSFISIPLCIQSTEGRVFMASERANYTRADLVFLGQIANQVVPVLENIYLLDRLASEAALRERRKISRDLHDSTVQPYIGLSHTLTALRAKAAPDNPLYDELETLANMTAEVVRDLRHYVGDFTRESSISAPLFYGALRHHVRQVRLIHGIDITLEMPVELDMGDRLAAAAFHLVSEGISNIRKHTCARTGRVRLRREGDLLRLDIENPNDPGPAPAFSPASISARTLSLGGTIKIEQRVPSATAVCIAIPV